MLKKITFSLLSLIFAASTFAQENVIPKFTPSGSPFAKVYANYHTDFADVSVMELKRVYIGYNYKLSETFSMKANIDVNKIDEKYIALLKIAQLQYKKEKITIKVGMIPTKQFKVQEKFWGYRYIQKSLQDEYKFNASADLGASIDYKILDNLSVDFIVQNGEGYKHLESTGTYRGGIGITYFPLKNLTLRAYSDISSKTVANRNNFAAFAGYKFKKKFRLAFEYNLQQGNKFTKGHDFSGISGYATYIINNKVNVFGRYDIIKSNKPDGETKAWNIDKDGNNSIIGIEYSPVKGVNISANYRGWQPDNPDMEYSSTVFLNFAYQFK